MMHKNTVYTVYSILQGWIGLLEDGPMSSVVALLTEWLDFVYL